MGHHLDEAKTKPPIDDDGKRWSFVWGQSAVVPTTIEEHEKEGFEIAEFQGEAENSQGFGSISKCERIPFIDAGSVDGSAIPTRNVPPLTAHASALLQFLKEHLAKPVFNARFAPIDSNMVHKRHPDLLNVCKEWIRHVNVAEIEGRSILINPIAHLFDSGKILTWIEIMAAAGEIHTAVDVLNILQSWTVQARTAQRTPDFNEKLHTIALWTTDLGNLLYSNGPCLKTFPNEIYYFSANFFPRDSPLRRQLEALSRTRGELIVQNPIESSVQESFKLLSLPQSIGTDLAFSSTDLTRFTFSRRGSMIVFRGAHQVIIFSAYSGNLLCTFHFGHREPTAVAFSPGSMMLGVTFSNNESRLLDLKGGRVIQEVRNSAIMLGRSVKRNNSISLGRGGKKLHTRHKSLDLSSDTENLNFSAMYLEERTSAVGPDGVHALLTGDGIFKVSDEGGNTLFFRRIRMDETAKKGSLRRSLTALKRTWTTRSVLGRSGSLRPYSRDIDSQGEPKRRSLLSWVPLSGKSESTLFKCHDITTHESEDEVLDHLLEQWKQGLKSEVKSENGYTITFNISGNVAILHVKNAFNTGGDVLHVANFCGKENNQLHLIHPTSVQPIAGYSVSGDGQLIALCTPDLNAISILNISQQKEVHRISLNHLHMSTLNGLTFAPDPSNTLMTSHATNCATLWELKTLKQRHISNGSIVERTADLNKVGHLISSAGDVIILIRAKDKGKTALRLDSSGESTFDLPQIATRSHPPIPSSITPDGTSALFGRTLYSWGSRLKVQKYPNLDGGEITHNAISSRGAIALLSTYPKVTVYNWPSGLPKCMWQIPQCSAVWDLTFDSGGGFLAVGLELGLELLHRDWDSKYAVYVFARAGNSMQVVGRSTEWTDIIPMKMAFKADGSLIVLGEKKGNLELAPRSFYSVLHFDITVKNTADIAPTIVPFRSSMEIRPIITSDGDVLYVGTGETEGWIMRVNYGREKDARKNERIAWLPLPWRAVGATCLLGGSRGGQGTIVCVNKVFGLAVLKVAFGKVYLYAR